MLKPEPGSTPHVEGAEHASIQSTAYPPLPIIRRLRFWLAYAIGLIGFGYTLLQGGFIFRGNFTVQLIGFSLALSATLAWLIWRWAIWRDKLPRTGAEWALLAALAAVLLSLVTSPDMRQGFSRSGWLLADALFFYFFLNILDTDLDRWGLLAAAVTIAGAALFQADVETLYWYKHWFEVSGGLEWPPTPYRFNGLLTSSHLLMALANLFVPAVLLALKRFHQPLVRVLCGLWLMLYAIAVPFSSSRGGWLGLAVALTIAALYWMRQSNGLGRLRRWPRRRRAGALIGGLALAALSGLLVYTFLVSFGSHPTHSGDPFGASGREVFWANAIKIWQTSPWLGIGPGRFAFEYLRIAPNTLPGFWPAQAHNLFFETLAEFGAVGLAALLIFLGALFHWAWQIFQRSLPLNRAWTVAVLAGECGLLAHLMVDNLTHFSAIMVPAIFLLAWVGAHTGLPLLTFRKISLGWLGLPILFLIAASGWGIWAYQPFVSWQSYAQGGQWSEAAQQASLSAQRDPNFHFYATEAGLLWAWQAHYQNDPIGLFRARAYFEQALRLEPSIAWNWANLAILDDQAGDNEAALAHMERAVRLAPNVPEFTFHLGRFYETAGLPEMAFRAYQKALTLQPEFRSLTAWQDTALRSQALALWQPAPPSPDALQNTFSLRAQAALQAGDLTEAERRLNQAAVMGESQIEVTRLAIRLAAARGDAPAEQRARERLAQFTEQNRMMWNVFVTFTYPAFLSSRDGTGLMVVPGLVP